MSNSILQRLQSRISTAVVVALGLSLVVGFPQTSQAATTGSTVENATTVNVVGFDPEPLDPAGVAYMGNLKLLVSDSEINEVFPNSYNNLWRMSRTGSIEFSGKIDDGMVEPTGLDYNAAQNRLYVSNDASKWIQEIDPGFDLEFGTPDDVSSFLSTTSFGVSDPEDVAWDGSRIFIAGGVENTVTPVSPGPSGSFGDGDDVVGVKMDLSWMTNDIEGIGYRASTDTLLIVDPTGGDSNLGGETIFEITKNGRLIRAIRFNVTGETPSDVAVAPATAGGGNNLFVVDRGTDSTNPSAAKDGRLYELSTPFANLAPWVRAGADKSTPVNRALTLAGDSYDDGQPTKSLTFSWVRVNGPGNVSFGSPTALMTTASFSQQGTYTLRLTASDGSKESNDDVVVTVTKAVNTIVGGVDLSTGIWRLFEGSTQMASFYYGNPADFPFYGDWDCDGVETPGLYRQSDGYVYLRNSNTQGIADISFFFGNPGDVPLAGDFDGDGCDTVSIYRPSEAKFYIINKLGSGDQGLGAAETSFFYGVPGDVPFVGDWTGNGIDTPGLRRNSDGFVYLRNTNTQGVADVNYFYGNTGDVVFTGDWDGDGDDTLGLYRPSNGIMYLRYTNSTGIADFSFSAGFGLYPIAGDN